MKKRYRENVPLASATYQIIAKKSRHNHTAIRQYRPHRGVIMRDFGAHSEVRLVAILMSAARPSASRRLAQGNVPRAPPFLRVRA